MHLNKTNWCVRANLFHSQSPASLISKHVLQAMVQQEALNVTSETYSAVNKDVIK